MKKIYIVDDDRMIVESISIVLRAHGYQVEAQYDEKNVIDNLMRVKPDLVILDVMFPENSSAGFEMAREIKNCSTTQNIPIIMLSAINEKGIYVGTFSNKDRDDSLMPVNEFVEKPIKPENLLKKVESTLLRAERGND